MIGLRPQAGHESLKTRLEARNPRRVLDPGEMSYYLETANPNVFDDWGDNELVLFPLLPL